MRAGTRVAACIMLFVHAMASAAWAQQRPLEPEDLFRIERVSSVAWSPDGRHVAVGISSGLRALPTGGAAGVLWILDTRDRTFAVLPVPHEGVIGMSHAVWSATGRRLAFLVRDEQAVTSPWLWHAGDSVATRIEDVDVPLGYGESPLVWLDDTSLLVVARNAGAPRSGSVFFEALRGHYAPELWLRARDGREASVTVLESGGVTPGGAKADVLLVDVANGERRTVLSGRPHRLRASPDGRRLAYFAENPGIPRQRVASYFEHAELYDAVNWGSELRVVDIATGVDVIPPADIVDAGYESLVWSPDGRLALPGRIRGAAAGNGLLLAGEGHVAAVGVAGLARIDASSVRWLDGQPVVRARARPADRWDWWLLAPGAYRNLTAGLDAAPPALSALPDGTLVGAAGGDLWRISASAEPVNMGRASGGPITALRTVDAKRATFTGAVAGRRDIIRIDDGRLTVTPLLAPLPGAVLRSISPSGDAAVFTSDDAAGTRLWLSGGVGRPVDDAVEVWHGNRWLARVRGGEAQYFRYTGEDGTDYGAWLLLPPGHTHGERLPVVVDVYPGSLQQEAEPPFRLLDAYYLNPHLFAARGYAVLVPSLPAIDELPAAERLPSLTIGVLPAVDTLIARGIAHPDRLAVVGQSGGGYATLGIIAHTTRFRAAIASASYSNLTSLYGTFYGEHRYGDSGDPQQAQVLRMLQLERGYGGMGATPWEDAEGYNAASPLFHAARVHTPVMLIHGDYDFIPIQQAEEYFTALYRQDRRVQLVRYHGEGHVITTRGNILDAWQRIDAWLAEMLANPN